MMGNFITKICNKIFISAILAILLSSCAGKDVMEISKLVPDEMHSWKKHAKDEIYDTQTIFDYMNGAGEIYRSYNFRKLFVRYLTKPYQPTITIELFDMGSSEDAFGVFTHGCESGKEGIGQNSEYRDGLLCFWQDKFFVCVYAEQETASSKKAVLDLGKAIANSIKTVGIKPKLLEYLPEEDLIKSNIRYFHNHTSLNHHYFVSDENILNLNKHTDAILASYNDESRILCVRYPDKKQAKLAFDKFVSTYLPELKQKDIPVQLENSNWSAADIYQEFVIVIFDATDKEYAKFLLEGVKNKLEEEFNE
jgi:hypothetical protein